MGLGRSRHRPEKGGGEEQKKACSYSGPQRKGRPVDRRAQEAEGPADGFSPKKGTDEQLWLPCEVQEKPDANVKVSKENVVPQIVITRASNETLSSIKSEEQRTIEERVTWGPYSRHRNPSTVDAYHLQNNE